MFSKTLFVFVSDKYQPTSMTQEEDDFVRSCILSAIGIMLGSCFFFLFEYPVYHYCGTVPSFFLLGSGISCVLFVCIVSFHYFSKLTQSKRGLLCSYILFLLCFFFQLVSFPFVSYSLSLDDMKTDCSLRYTVQMILSFLLACLCIVEMALRF